MTLELDLLGCAGQAQRTEVDTGVSLVGGGRGCCGPEVQRARQTPHSEGRGLMRSWQGGRETPAVSPESRRDTCVGF